MKTDTKHELKFLLMNYKNRYQTIKRRKVIYTRECIIYVNTHFTFKQAVHVKCHKKVGIPLHFVNWSNIACRSRKV